MTAAPPARRAAPARPVPATPRPPDPVLSRPPRWPGSSTGWRTSCSRRPAAAATSSCWASPPAGSRWRAGWPPGCDAFEGVTAADRQPRHHAVPRRPAAARDPGALEETDVPERRHRRQRAWCSSTTCCSPAGPSGRRSTPSPTSAGRGPCSSRCSSTAATASCRSGPTTSARTSRPRCARRCTCMLTEHDGRRRGAARPGRPAPARRPGRAGSPVKRHLLSAADLTRDDALLVLDTAEELAAVAARSTVKKLPTLRGRTVVNLFFEDSTRTKDQLRARRQAAVRRRHQLLRQGLQRVQGRDAQGHRAHPGGDGRRRRRHPALLERRAGQPGRAGCAARSSTPGTARTSTRPRRCSTRYTMRQRLGRLEGLQGDDRRRRAAQPGGPQQRAAAAHARRRGHPGRAADPAAGGRRDLAVRRCRTTSTRCCPRATS